MNDFYKTQFLQHSKNTIYDNVFPMNETQLQLDSIIRDTTVFYSNFPYWFFQRHWLTIEKKNIQLFVSPILDFSIGKNISQKTDKLFRNTRGVYIQGAIGLKFSFLFSFAENQARFLNYQNEYFDYAGEYYVQNGGYSLVNAVIPSGSRTKPFKVGAYDYAYAIGMLNYQVNKKLRFELGNQPNFVGIGYRSLLLSDHAINAMGLRANYQLNAKWSFQWLLKNHKNLYRKPTTNFIESPYENKLYTATYFTYKPIKNVAISLFSAANALRADSLIRHPMQWQSLLPIPILNTDIALKNSLMNGIVGMNLEWALKKWRFYGQIAMDKVDTEVRVAGQLGAYYFNAFSIRNWTLQVEGNIVPADFYTNTNDKLSYTHAQLPSAHPIGQNFYEFIFRSQYEWKQMYVDLSYDFYHVLSQHGFGYLRDNTLLQSALPKETLPDGILSNGNVHQFKIELGWRYNRKYNGIFYVNYQYHSNYIANTTNRFQVQSVMVGWKTGLFNQYLDF